MFEDSIAFVKEKREKHSRVRPRMTHPTRMTHLWCMTRLSRRAPIFSLEACCNRCPKHDAAQEIGPLNLVLWHVRFYHLLRHKSRACLQCNVVLAMYCLQRNACNVVLPSSDITGFNCCLLQATVCRASTWDLKKCMIGLGHEPSIMPCSCNRLQ